MLHWIPHFQTGPPEHVEIAATIHVPGINLACTWVNEIIIDEHLIPCSDKVEVNIIRRLQNTVHSQEAHHSTIEGVMEGDCVQRIEGSIMEKKFVLTCGQVCCGDETGGTLCWCLSSTTAETC